MIIFEDSYLQKKKPPVVHIYFLVYHNRRQSSRDCFKKPVIVLSQGIKLDFYILLPSPST